MAYMLQPNSVLRTGLTIGIMIKCTWGSKNIVVCFNACCSHSLLCINYIGEYADE